MYTIDQVEDAIITRLQSQVSGLKTCASLGDFLIDDISDITLRFPAVYVAYDGGSYSFKTNVCDRAMFFTAIVMDTNMRGERQTMLGAYQLILDVFNALIGQKCGLSIRPLLPVDERSIAGNETMAAYGIQWKTSCRFTGVFG